MIEPMDQSNYLMDYVLNSEILEPIAHTVYTTKGLCTTKNMASVVKAGRVLFEAETGAKLDHADAYRIAMDIIERLSNGKIK